MEYSCFLSKSNKKRNSISFLFVPSRESFSSISGAGFVVVQDGEDSLTTQSLNTSITTLCLNLTNKFQQIDFFLFIFTVTDSPHTERFERKDSIRRFLREQFQHDKKPKETTSTVASSNATATIPVASDAEHSKEPIKSKISAYRLFRTVNYHVPPLGN